MRIVDEFQGQSGAERTDTWRVPAQGDALRAEEEIPAEHLLSVYLNEVLTMKLVCSPAQLLELVLGRLKTEGMIDTTEDVGQIHICSQGSRASVVLTRPPQASAEPFVETTPSCCTGNRILSDLFAAKQPPQPVKPIPWREEWIFALARAFAEGTPIHRATNGTHSCFLAVEGQCLYCCEDLGRHNALDKAVGCALRDGVDLSRAILYTSGRVPTDMALKAVRAGVPVLVSKARPTDMAVELAQTFDLTLICSARPDCFSVYTRPDQ